MNLDHRSISYPEETTKVSSGFYKLNLRASLIARIRAKFYEGERKLLGAVFKVLG